jgi:uncharacterized small protein (DUF1192 family)
MSDDIEDIVAMARAAYRDERLADGPLYGKLADEIERLRARVAVLERVRAAADDFFAYERSWYWGEKFKALLAALKEATP